MRRTIFSQRAQRNAESAETKYQFPGCPGTIFCNRICFRLALSAFLCALCENTVYACLNNDTFSWERQDCAKSQFMIGALVRLKAMKNKL